MEFKTIHLSSGMENKYSVNTKTGEGVTCFQCGFPITERYLLNTNDQFWHLQCVRCFVCQASLETHQSCFFKGDNIYCRLHYYGKFGTKCHRCHMIIESTDWVHRVHQQVYHLACFSCSLCNKQLGRGDEYVVQERDVVCAQHTREMFQARSLKDFENDQKMKRLRTNISLEQTRILQGNYTINRIPDSVELVHISNITRLNKRVVQVWFQNARAKEKKQKQKEDSSPEFKTTATRPSPCQWGSTCESQDSST